METKSTYSLSKYLAQTGVASRRKAVDIIKSGLVTVNGSVITEPGMKIVTNDSILVNGKTIRLRGHFIYILINKPKNCISTVSDELGRQSIINLISSEIKERVYPIGRLDRNTTGLLVITNDGNLSLRLSHPRYEVQKTYHVQLDKAFSFDDMQRLFDGIGLEDGVVSVDEAYFVDKRFKKVVGVVLHSGKNRIVRRLFASLGYEVKKLDRVSYAGLTKKGIKAGQWRYLTSQEVAYLKQL